MAVTDKERDECVAAAAERLTAMRRLVDALFEYAKADDGARALVVVPVDVGAVVAACVADLHPPSSSGSGSRPCDWTRTWWLRPILRPSLASWRTRS
ncbi:hypothetical protein [Adlercreutzia caecimuris]|nr:hypothetical protein [Adlercreutzia caecimuris]